MRSRRLRRGALARSGVAFYRTAGRFGLHRARGPQSARSHEEIAATGGAPSVPMCVSGGRGAALCRVCWQLQGRCAGSRDFSPESGRPLVIFLLLLRQDVVCCGVGFAPARPPGVRAWLGLVHLAPARHAPPMSSWSCDRGPTSLAVARGRRLRPSGALPGVGPGDGCPGLIRCRPRPRRSQGIVCSRGPRTRTRRARYGVGGRDLQAPTRARD